MTNGSSVCGKLLLRIAGYFVSCLCPEKKKGNFNDNKLQMINYNILEIHYEIIKTRDDRLFEN